MVFFYFSKYQFLSVLLLSYTFLTSLLITRCSASNIVIFGTANSDLDQLQLLEKTNSFLADTKLNIESQQQVICTLDCENEYSFQENTLNLEKHLQEERRKNTGAFYVFGIRIANPTSECEQQLANILNNMDLIQLYKASASQKSENDQGDLEIFVVLNTNEQQQKSQFDTENSNFDISKIHIMHQGVEAGDIGIVLVVLILLGLAAAGVVIFLKRKKKAQKKQLKVEKQKFIPRLQLSSQAPFNGQKEAGSKPSSTKKNKNLDVPKILSPTGRHAHALRLEDNHQSSIINDNIFTNLDNSPRSVDADDSDIQSVKNTPKDIGFNIEFSMIEQDSKIKSARDHDE